MGHNPAADERRADVLSKLTTGIEELTRSEQWAAWLRATAKFHKYSWQNSLLILLQRPSSTRVAGFHAWKALGRSVSKGEKGIAILAPVLRRRDVEDEDDDSRGTDPVGYRLAYVWDIAQTVGQELPEIPCAALEGAGPEGAFDRLLDVAAEHGFAVTLDGMADSIANGDTNLSTKRIRVRESMEPAQQLRTLCHELGHMLLHADGFACRGVAELEAESVAFVVGQALALDTGSYSFGYVASWAGGGEEAIAGIRASGSRISRAARTIIERVVGDSADVGVAA